VSVPTRQLFDSMHFEIGGLRQCIQASDRVVQAAPTPDVEGGALRA
jgi:hypothetical protein